MMEKGREIGEEDGVVRVRRVGRSWKGMDEVATRGSQQWIQDGGSIGEESDVLAHRSVFL